VNRRIVRKLVPGRDGGDLTYFALERNCSTSSALYKVEHYGN
jgi:hypothetical protein